MVGKSLSLIAAMLPIAAASLAAAPTTVLIADFESSSELARCEIRSTQPASTIALVSDHVTQGSHAAALFFPKWKEESTKWPAIDYNNDKGLPADWTGFKYVTVDVYNDNNYKLDIACSLVDNKGKRIGEHFFIEPRKQQTLRMDLGNISAGFDMSHVINYDIFVTQPKDDVHVVIDNIRLEWTVKDSVADLAGKLAEAKRKYKAYSSQLAPLWKKIDAAYSDLVERSRTDDRYQLETLKPEIYSMYARLEGKPVRIMTEAAMLDSAHKINPSLNYACAFASSMQKVLPRDVYFTCDLSQEGKVELAGNETESIQLLIYAFDQELKKVAVEVGPLASIDGKSAASGITVQASPVGFVKTERPPYEVKYIGWYPDPILDFLKSFSVKQGDVQPVWIRVKTAPGAPAGDYRCDLTIRPTNAAPYKVGLNVHVWGFGIPEERHLRTAMSLYDSFLASAYGTETDEMRMKYEEFFLDYRINPDNIYRKTPPKIEDLERWNKLGLNAFNLMYIRKIDEMKPGQPYPEAEIKKIFDTLDAIIPQLKEKGLYKKAYVYGFDEINSGTFFAMKDVMDKIRARYPDLYLMTTAYDASYGENSKIDAIDAWVPLTPSYNKERADKVRARGKQVWWYICCGPRAPYANWFVDYDAIDARSLMGMQTAKLQPDGFLYYAMMRWPLTKKPIKDGPYTDWPPASFQNYNGDGSIACAGPDGPLATIRLENIRDGIEDYEYFWLLRNETNKLKVVQSKAAARALRQAENALSIGSDLVESTTKFSKSPEAILAKRRQIAEAILAVQRVNANLK